MELQQQGSFTTLLFVCVCSVLSKYSSHPKVLCFQKLKQGVQIDPWAVAVFDSRCHDADLVAQQLLDSCVKRGMRMRRAAAVEKEPPNAMGFSPEQRVERMITALRPHKPCFILVILPDKDSPIYGQ